MEKERHEEAGTTEGEEEVTKISAIYYTICISKHELNNNEFHGALLQEKLNEAHHELRRLVIENFNIDM